MIVILCITLLLVVLNIYLYHKFPSYPLIKNKHYDACIVLGSPTNEDGSCSRIQKSRMDRAIELYKNQQVSIIIISGGAVKNRYYETRTMTQYATSLGVEKSQIILEEQARNSYENLLYAKALCELHHYNSVVVVTSNFHVRRATFFVQMFFDEFAMAGTREKEKMKYYIYEYFRMWNTLRVEIIKHFKKK